MKLTIEKKDDGEVLRIVVKAEACETTLAEVWAPKREGVDGIKETIGVLAQRLFLDTDLGTTASASALLAEALAEWAFEFGFWEGMKRARARFQKWLERRGSSTQEDEEDSDNAEN